MQAKVTLPLAGLARSSTRPVAFGLLLGVGVAVGEVVVVGVGSRSGWRSGPPPRRGQVPRFATADGACSTPLSANAVTEKSNFVTSRGDVRHAVDVERPPVRPGHGEGQSGPGCCHR